MSTTPPRCSTHDVELLPDPEWKGRLLVCPVRGCDVHHLGKPQRQPKLPGLDPGRQSRIIRATEASLVSQWCQWGGLEGYTIFEVGQQVHYLRCPACRKAVKQVLCPHCEEVFPPDLRSQSTTGTPDTFWGRREWGAWVVPIEAKKSATAPVREEQKRFVELGISKLAWSLEMVQETLRQAEITMKRLRKE